MSDINTELSDAVLRVEFNRPSRKNAMTAAMYTRFAEILAEADANEAVRVVLWHAAGDTFSAGNDVEDFLKNPPPPQNSPQAQLMAAFVAFSKPIVAAVQGAAIGGGTTMLTHCDVVYAGEGAKFQTPFVDLALVPEFGSSFSLPARIGHLRAAELILLGDRISAQRAAELGLVTRVVADADLLAIAAATAHRLSLKAPGALAASKRLLKQQTLASLQAAIAAEMAEFTSRVTSADAKEALSAFMEKRPPTFANSAHWTAAE
jgi:enoyl-CoA hydratase/carnithine racemase